MNKKMLGIAALTLLLAGCRTCDVVPGPKIPEIADGELIKPKAVEIDARLLQECSIVFSEMPAESNPLVVLETRRKDLQQSVACALNHNELVRILKEKLSINAVN